MKTKVNDGSGLVTVDVDDGRYATLLHAARAFRLFAPDSGEPYGRTGARDATEAESFAIGQLTHLEQKVFARWYQPLKYEQLLAGVIDFSAGPHAKAVDYLISDGVGIGRLMSAAANDIPMVDVAFAKKTMPVAIGGIGYDYTQEDIRTSAFLRQPLSSTKQVQAVLAYKRHMNKVALQGEPASNFTGMYNATGATAANRSSGAVWDAATGDTIISDIGIAYGAYAAASGGNSVPTKMILPLSTRQLLRKRVGSTSDTTIEAFVAATFKLDISDDIALETLGAGATKRVVFADPTNDNMVMHIPMPLQFMAPQVNGYRWIVPGEYKYAGFELRRVQTIRYMDGV